MNRRLTAPTPFGGGKEEKKERLKKGRRSGEEEGRV